MSIFKIIAFSAVVGAAFGAPACHAAKVKPLHGFAGGADGALPQTELISNGDILYGTTAANAYENPPCSGTGSDPCGTVFSVNRKTGAYALLYGFKAAPDGRRPSGRLLYANNALYGTTDGGGSAGNGTVFAVNPTTGAETVLHNFAQDGNGALPISSLIYNNGMLYGTASVFGGASCQCGVIFAMNPTTGAETVLYSFKGGTDGKEPMGDLAIQGTIVYGATYAGGANGTGTVFSFDLSTNTETALYTFGAESSTDGAFPYAGVTLQNGMLYGTTFGGGGTNCPRGVGGCGTVFQVNPGTGTETVLYRLPGEGGAQTPIGSVALLNGSLYTPSASGGKKCRAFKKSTCGTLLAVNPATQTGQVVYSFTGKADGSDPVAGLLLIGNQFYGTAQEGGTAGVGTIFSFKP